MDKRRRPRALTLTLPHRRQPFLMLQGKKYTLRNVSEGGVGLWVPTPLPFGLHKGNRINGDILIDNHIYPVRLEVRHFSEKLVGLQIVHHSKELQAIFKKIMEPADYAATLHPQAKTQTEDSHMGFPRVWFAGDGTTELLVWYHPRHSTIMAIQLIWLGRWVYREQFQNARTGFVQDGPLVNPGRLVPDSELLLLHENPDPEILQSACHFLTCVNPPLPGHLLWQFLETGEQVCLPDMVLSPTG